MNLTGQKISAGTAPSEILPLLGDQLVNCVLWEPSVLGMIKAQGTGVGFPDPCCLCVLFPVQDGITEYYECGPMKQLKSM